MKEYNIPFVGLAIGTHVFEYKIGSDFFEHFSYEEFDNPNFEVSLKFDKKANFFELDFEFDGKVNVICDVSNENFDLELKGKLKLIVRFGEEYNDDNPEILIIPHGSYQIEVAQYIYEMIILSLPSKKIHPGIEDGTLDSETYNKLKDFHPTVDFEGKEDIDPRWDKLKKIINKVNK